MSIERFLRQESTELERQLAGAAVFFAGILLLALVIIRPENLPLRILHAFVGVLFITVVPGYLLRQLLEINEGSTTQMVLNTIGLSVCYCVGIAVIFDTLPIRSVGSLQNGVFTGLLVLTTGVMTFVVVRRKGWESLRNHRPFNYGRRLWVGIVLFTAIPVISILGTYFVNQTNANQIALIFVLLTAVSPTILWTGLLPRKLEPYAIFCVALAVLYFTTLISPHIWGWDTHYEYSAALSFLELGGWNASATNSLSALVTVTLFSAIYASVTGIPLAWVFKAVFPLLFALMPVGIYWISSRVFEDRSVALLAPFFAIFYYGFFKVIPGKQAFAEIFVVLFVMAALSTRMGGSRRNLLAACFLTGLVFSHYATSLLFLVFFATTVVGLIALSRVVGFTNPQGLTIARPSFVILLASVWILWFSVTADGVILERVVSTVGASIDQLFTQSSKRSGIAYASRSYGSLLWTLHKGIYVIVIGLSGLGVLRELISLYRRKRIDVRGEYAVIGAVVCVFVASSTILTYNMGFDRVLQIGLVILAPFVVLGARWPVVLIQNRISLSVPTEQHITPALAVVLAIMFVFSSGAIFAIAGDDVPAYSIGLDKDAGFPVYTDQEVAASRWVDEQLPVCAEIGVYSDRSRPNSRDGLLLSEVLPQQRIKAVSPDASTAQNITYMYVSDRPLDETDDLGDYIDPNSTTYYEETLSQAEIVYSRENVNIYRVDDEQTCSPTQLD